MSETAAHLIAVLVVDHDRLGADQIREVLESTSYPNDCIGPRVVGHKTAAVDWTDEHPLNGPRWRGAIADIFDLASPIDPLRGALSAAEDLEQLADSLERAQADTAAVKADAEATKAVAQALYLKLLAVAKTLGQYEATEALETDLAEAHATLVRLGVL